MKKQLIALSVLAALPFAAQSQMYVGGKVGYSFLKNACVASEPCDDNSVGFGGYMGYQYSPSLSIEAGLERIGDFKTNYGAGTEMDGALNQLTFAPKFNAPLTDSLDFYGKLGVSLSKYASSDTDFSLLSALGLEYFINPNVSTRLEYQMAAPHSYDSLRNVSSGLVSLGLTYRFGSAQQAYAEPMQTAAPAEPVAEPAPVAEAAAATAVVAQTITFRSQHDVGLFETGSNELSPSALHQFDELKELLLTYPQSSVTIVGHTDNTGRAEFNQKLSEQRAQSVADYLASQGVDKNRITVRGDGETNPIASNDTAAGREQNRRVEVTVGEFTAEK